AVEITSTGNLLFTACSLPSKVWFAVALRLMSAGSASSGAITFQVTFTFSFGANSILSAGVMSLLSQLLGTSNTAAISLIDCSCLFWNNAVTFMGTPPGIFRCGSCNKNSCGSIEKPLNCARPVLSPDPFTADMKTPVSTSSLVSGTNTVPTSFQCSPSGLHDAVNSEPFRESLTYSGPLNSVAFFFESSVPSPLLSQESMQPWSGVTEILM